jgi:hypothetical protein
VTSRAQRPTEGAPVQPPPVLPQVRPVPGWIGPVFTVLATGTVPWTVYLALTLPDHIQTRNYRVAWVGFDIGLVALMVLTAWLAYRGNRHIAMVATATAMALVIDAWFDVVTAPRMADLTVALLTALLGELPMAALCLWLALHVDRVIARRLRRMAGSTERGAGRGRGPEPDARAPGVDGIPALRRRRLRVRFGPAGRDHPAA